MGLCFILFCLPGGSEDEQALMEDEHLTDREESDQEVKSVSEGKPIEDAEGSPNHAEEVNEEDKLDTEEKLAEDAEPATREETKVDEEADESSKGTGDEANEDGKSDNEANQQIVDGGPCPANLEKDDAELSPDEPLVLNCAFIHE